MSEPIPPQPNPRAEMIILRAFDMGELIGAVLGARPVESLVLTRIKAEPDHA